MSRDWSITLMRLGFDFVKKLDYPTDESRLRLCQNRVEFYCLEEDKFTHLKQSPAYILISVSLNQGPRRGLMTHIREQAQEVV